MTNSATAPRRVLLATDLGPDGDRALERALQVRQQWDADLAVLHVRQAEEELGLDAPRGWLRDADPVQDIRRRLRLEIGDQAAQVEILLEDGDAARKIDETAAATQCDLIVMGAARRSPYSLLELGETLDRVLRRTSTPILVVRGRTQGPYRQAVFATDLREASSVSHSVATSLFPEPVYSYLHAFDAPMAGLVEDSAAFKAEAGRAAEKDLEAFAAKLPVQRDGGAPALVTKHGAPARVVCEHAAAIGADLVIMTASGRGLIAELLLGSVVKDALECLTSDVLLVPEV